MIIHVELGEQVPSLIHNIKSLGKKVGLAINPPTEIAAVQPFFEHIDLLLVMTVNLESSRLKHGGAKKKLSYRISVDGGINDQTAAECARAGADTFVAGTSLFGAPSLKAVVKKMRQIVNENQPDAGGLESLRSTGESNSPDSFLRIKMSLLE